MPIRVTTVILSLALITLPAYAHDFTEWRTGDLVFQDSAGPQSAAIRIATKSRYTHMGIVRLTPSGPVVIEAARTVSETPLAKFLARGQQGQYAVYRLNTATPESIQTALAEASRYTGRPYDIFFRLEPDAIYCSELPYYAFKAAGITLGKTERFGTLAVDNPAVRTLFLARWERHPDCQATDQAGCWQRIQEQLLVTPASIAADQQITRIFSNFPQE
ncbi:YiiX/YebB-like N1pC/P60 family cysteine hydrolase [Bordetella genomosp. 4]|uniref:Peptidoglycan peptidase n=1 Tax=Bordetella genomosp. 4 TaxID=463044 RepID=A0A261UD03_9BORD|nr:YiiX/YebB-like N1pC/P60 family cysteine hydrolase [Bordetella genomosp. 4]OZI52655.1 hypothetical protein CAL21_03245 [Bordetella genomosp. 4]OZI59110.1 hypothetical protein CAL20_05620 [Bordetella genomosp. 4]